ncbi:MAG: hypothetical protein PHH08_00070 [Candidatus ainarchaeum sp.]|nr:hypothetical protein [Candidatus ainarchaeum sp.]
MQPTMEAQTAIKSIASKPATPYTSRNTVFGPNIESSINTRSIAEGSGGLVSLDMVCVSAGDFANDPVNWPDTSGNMSVVKYSGSSAKTVSFEAICDKGDFIFKGGANGSGPDDYFATYDPRLQIPGVDWKKCPCIASGSLEICCVIALKKV